MYDGWKVLEFLEGITPIVLFLFVSALVAPTGKGHGHRNHYPDYPDHYHGGR